MKRFNIPLGRHEKKIIDEVNMGRTDAYTLSEDKDATIASLLEENEKYSLGMQENCTLRARIEELERELAEERENNSQTKKSEGGKS